MNKEWIINRAADSAEVLYKNGAISKARVADWIVAEANVRARAARQGKQLTPRQVQKKVRGRLAGKGIGRALRLVVGSLLPIGRPIFEAVAENLEQAITQGIERANSELE